MDGRAVGASRFDRDREPLLTHLLLDTTYLIDADRSGVGLDEVIADDDDVAIAAITVAELRAGVLLASGRARTARAAFTSDVLAAIPIMDYDSVVAEAHAELLVEVRRQGKPRGAHDLLIAATAKASRRTVVTEDASAFANLSGIDVRHHG